MLFAKAKSATPLLNTPYFDKVFCYPLPLNECGRLAEVELVALPNTPFTVGAQISPTIVQVITPHYPSNTLFADSRFLTFSDHPFLPLTPKLPSKKELLDALYSKVGLPYIWGGNWSAGIPELLEYYPINAPLAQNVKQLYTLAGVDCSGILYEVTGGYTPRNTSELINFGQEASFPLQSLDLIVWKGHVVIVGKPGEFIEAHGPSNCVLITQQKERFKEIEQKYAYVIRRWI